jgi:hypothetical protein
MWPFKQIPLNWISGGDGGGGDDDNDKNNDRVQSKENARDRQL